MSLSITNLKKGVLFQYEGEPFRVVDYNQKVMGRGGSIVNVRIKSLLDGKVLEKTFKGNEQLDSADVTNQSVQYLYSDGANFFFMNEDTFNQFEVGADLVGDNAGFMKEGDIVQLQFFNDQPINVELPKNVPLLVTYSEDAVKGDTSSSITKDATLETGITVKVPAFIKKGDVISVDTATGAYRERVKKQVKTRLDQYLAASGRVASRSQAESYIKLGRVRVNGKIIKKPGTLIIDRDTIDLQQAEQYVSRAGLKLASVAEILNLDFKNKVVLDVGSSTGGFTDYALKHGAAKSIAVELGSNQLHPTLIGNPKIELHEKTDIINFVTDQKIDIVVADVSFISLRQILPAVASLASQNTQIVTMVKPQFEAINSNIMHKGVIKNDKIRRQILKEFEAWSKQYFVIKEKADSEVSGAKGNLERFYLLEKIS